MSRWSILGLLLRQRAHGRGASYLVSVLVLAVSALLVAGPSAFTAMAVRELTQTVRDTTPTGRYLIATTSAPPAEGPSGSRARSPLEPELDQEYGAFTDQLSEIRSALPQPLRDNVGAPGWSITTTRFALGIANPQTDPPGAAQDLVLRVDPLVADKAELVEGRWPALDETSADPVGVVLSEDSAEHLAWRVGEKRHDFRLTGIFRARDASDDYWALNDAMLQTSIRDDGNSLPTITAYGFVQPLRWDELYLGPLVVGLKIWFPLDLGGLAGGQAEEVIGQLRGVTAKTFPVPMESSEQNSISFSASGLPALEDARGRTQSARSVLTLAGMGPLGAGLVVLVLGIRAFAARRRQAVGLLATRGASSWQVRGVLFAEGLLIGLPPALVAVAATRWVFGADLSPGGVAVAGVAGLAPAIGLASVRIDAATRPARADTGVRSRSRHRWVAEVGVLALAAASVYLLVSSGLRTADEGRDVDVLVAAAPVLLAAAACVVVLRLYPLPLQAVARALRRGRSAVGFLGSTRALRDPSVGAAPVLAVLAGVAVAVFSAVVLATLTHGTRDAAMAGVGADLRLDGPFVTEDMADRARELGGVRAAARVARVDSRTVGSPGKAPATTAIYLADLTDLADVQREVPGRAPLPDRANGDGVVVSTALDSDERTISFKGGTATVLGSSAGASGVVTDEERWVLADRSVTELGSFNPTTLLVALEPGADTAVVKRGLEGIVGDTGVVFTDTAAVEEDLRDDAISSGLRTALLAAIAAAGLAGAATVLLTLVLGARARSRMLAILRVLGFTHRQRRWVAVWEQAPSAIGALVVGTGLGLGLAVLVHRVVDLSPFTGEEEQPALVVDRLVLTGLVGGFVMLMAVAIGLGLLATRRTSAAVAVRLDEE